jgi:hypothetical protein
MNASVDTRPWRAPLRGAACLLIALVLAVPASAQRLAEYLPADTVLALGTVDLDAHADLLDGVLADWQRHGVGEALERALGGVDAGMFGVPLDEADVDVDLPEALADLELLDLVGREAWLALSISPFNPLPTLTLVASVDDAVGARFDAVLADAAEEPGAQRLTEGDTRFVALVRDGVPLAAARRGDLLVLATNPEVLRGVLRLAQGGNEPGFSDGAGYQSTLATLAPGQFYGFLDLQPVARAVTPLASGLGFDRSVARLAATLETFGASAGVLRLTSAGSESESVQLLRADGRDPALFRLLSTDAGGVPPQLRRAIPIEAISVSASAGSPRAGFDYLIGLLRELPELALPDPEGLIGGLIGIDLREALFSWMAPGMLTVTIGFGEAVAPGVPSDQLLGETALVLLTEDDARARAGLERTAGLLGSLVSAFADPMGAGGVVPGVRRDVAGIDIVSYAVLPGASLHVAVADGFAIIATSAGAADAVARAIAQGPALAPTLARLLPEVPDQAVSFTLSDDRATLEGTADQLALQVQLLAGLAGGSGLDFDAVDAATDALQGFLDVVAARLGGTVSYSVVDGNVLRGFSRSEIDWR